jgi:hypothetical protein
MALSIETFSNLRGGNAFFKAVTHPIAARAMKAQIDRLGDQPIAIVDPDGAVEALAEIHDLSGLNLTGVFVQDLTAIGRSILGHAAQPITELVTSRARAVFIATFDARRLLEKIAPLTPERAELFSLDATRLPDSYLANKAYYLDKVNFATNFVFFRDAGGNHTRLASANYWTGYGARKVSLQLVLFGGDGRMLAQWREEVAPNGAIVIDSREVRTRFCLAEFTGQLFLHAIGVAGHDVVKYALDTFTDRIPGSLSSTHDANSWPAQFYAGLPAPADDERVTLWIQNSLPCAIPAGAVSLNLMGEDGARALDRAIPPFASHALDVASLWPEARWPKQFEVSAGKYFVRPRYEVERAGKRRIAHVNVERTDLKPDPRLAELGNLLGKGYLLPAPILPRADWCTTALPTPMARSQSELPLALLIYDGSGAEVARRPLGRIARAQAAAIDLDEAIDGAALPSGFGHFELIYDFSDGGEGDGWLHALFRYRHRASGHEADSSFGAHIFNTPLIYKDEPQSYSGRPPGLSTRLYLRLGEGPYDTLCHLIYPASTPWHAKSATDLILHDRAGGEVARRRIAIPCSGSWFFRYSEMFDDAVRGRAESGGFVVIRDATCRLFGYHGLIGSKGEFSLDHMFGF